MSRIHVCQACVNLRNGVKTRIAVDHTCGKSQEEIMEEIKNVDANKQRVISTLQALSIISEQQADQGKVTCPACGG